MCPTQATSTARTRGRNNTPLPPPPLPTRHPRSATFGWLLPPFEKACGCSVRVVSVGTGAALKLGANGDADLVLTRQFDPVLFYENRRSKPAAWIGFDVKGDGRAVNADATGAVLELSQGTERWSHSVLNVSGFTAQGDRRVVIGLSGNASPVSASILWPDSTRQDLGEFESGKYHLIRHADGSADFSRRE